MRITAAALILILAGPSGARAQSSAGSESFEFMLQDVDARAAALGGAYTAITDGANALHYNPAGLGLVTGHEAAFSHFQLGGDLSQDFAGYAHRSGLGLGFNYRRLAAIPRSTLLAPGGTGETFDDTAMGVTVGYGRAFLERSLILGASGKFLRQSIDAVSANGWAGDVGALYRVPALPGLSLGAAALNMGPDAKFLNLKERLPLAVRAGAAYSFEASGYGATISFDLSKTRGDALRLGVGTETLLNRFLALRIGFTTRNDADVGISGGMGFYWKSLRLDYAIVPFGELGLSHRASVALRWGGEPEAPRTAKAKPAAAPKAKAPSASEEAAMGAVVEVSIEERFKWVQGFIAAKAYSKALSELLAIEELLAPDDRRRVRYHERLGFLHYQNRECGKASASYMEGLRIAGESGLGDPVIPEIYTGMGLCLVAQGRNQYAERFFKKALEANPSPKTKRQVEAELQRLKKLQAP